MEARLRALEAAMRLLEGKSAERETRLGERCGSLELQVIDLRERMEAKAHLDFLGDHELRLSDMNRRIEGLEKCAVDAIDTARKCIAQNLQANDERIRALEEHHQRFMRDSLATPAEIATLGQGNL